MATLPLAMHMGNELLSVPVAAVTLALAAGAVAISAHLGRKSLDTEKLPLMGVMGAFIFAAQMINFTLPGLGTSGHLGGGVLLAILLGPAAAIVTMACILIVQCLLFSDGGLLALGCNIINMGVIPCLLGWGVYRVILGRRVASPGRLYIAAWLACMVGVAGGATAVPLESTLSGVLPVKLGDFMAIMVALHLFIGFIEGLITFAVLAFLRRTRPALLGMPADSAGAGTRLSRPALSASLLCTALLVAGVVSWFASTHPDGLDWTLEHFRQKYAITAQPPPAVAQAGEFQKSIAPMADYNWHIGWVSLAGVAGTLATLAIVYCSARLLVRKRQPDRPAV